MNWEAPYFRSDSYLLDLITNFDDVYRVLLHELQPVGVFRGFSEAYAPQVSPVNEGP